MKALLIITMLAAGLVPLIGCSTQEGKPERQADMKVTDLRAATPPPK